MQHVRKRRRNTALALVDGNRLDATPRAVMRARTASAARIWFWTLRSTNKMSFAVEEAPQEGARMVAGLV